jgi:hypothetical protein
MKNQRIIKILKNSLTILLMGFALQVYSQPVFTDNVTDSVSIKFQLHILQLGPVIQILFI